MCGKVKFSIYLCLGLYFWQCMHWLDFYCSHFLWGSFVLSLVLFWISALTWLNKAKRQNKAYSLWRPYSTSLHVGISLCVSVIELGKACVLSGLKEIPARCLFVFLLIDIIITCGLVVTSDINKDGLCIFTS